jgi:collagenase-like PrtC family protease
LHCSKKRLTDPVNYLRSVWIRPEDLSFYETLGYSTFKIVERSCPTDLIVKRTLAYASRSFDGNLLELVGQVASIKKELNTSVFQHLRMLKILFRPSKVKIKSLLLFKRYAEQVIMHDYAENSSYIYIDNKKLNGFIEGIKKHDCSSFKCPKCNYCKSYMRKAIRINNNYRSAALKNAEKLDQGLFTGEHW